MADPLKQFEIKRLLEINVGGVDLSFTNASLFMVLTTVAVGLFMVFATKRAAIIPGRMQTIAETLYGTVSGIMEENVGEKGKAYFPFVLTLFLFILFANLIGLIPGSFTVTSHIAVTFALAGTVFVGVTIIGIFRHGFKFLRTFFPDGVPLFMAPLIVPVEVISYLSRPISLSARLFANMVVGHVLLKIIAGFIAALGIFGILPFTALVGITALEFLVAMLQAYIFAILTSIYLHDAIHLH